MLSPFAVVLLLCWGAILNMLAHRFISEQPFLAPIPCRHCKKSFAWYEYLPFIGWLATRGGHVACGARRPILDPFVEILTLISLGLLLRIPPAIYLPAYFLFFSALLITIRTDLETMLISRFATLWILPIAPLLAAIGYLPLSPLASLGGAVFGYFLLYGIARFFFWATGKHGMGQGDLELLALIGAFTGPIGCWLTLLIGSITGSLIGIGYALLKGKAANVKIPFGLFLALGAMIATLFVDEILHTLLGIS